jgi:hypothetical protein
LDYAGALAEVSTAPHYVRIILEDSDGKAHQTCVFGGSLNLAIRPGARCTPASAGRRSATPPHVR